jgi:NADPH-dependent F420 reductase
MIEQPHQKNIRFSTRRRIINLKESSVKIAVLGTGMVGQAHAGRLDELGHEVTVGTHDPKKSLARMEAGQMTQAFGKWAKQHPKVKVEPFSDSVMDADLVIAALSAQGVLDVLKTIASGLEGKVLIDITNPLDFSGGELKLTVANTDSMGEQIQRSLPKTKVVKAFNTMNTKIQVDPKTVAGGDHHLFIAGDDDSAKKQVSKLAAQYGWKNIIDLGDIKASRGVEMVFVLWMSIFRKLGTPMFNYKISR